MTASPQLRRTLADIYNDKAREAREAAMQPIRVQCAVCRAEGYIVIGHGSDSVYYTDGWTLKPMKAERLEHFMFLCPKHSTRRRRRRPGHAKRTPDPAGATRPEPAHTPGTH